LAPILPSTSTPDYVSLKHYQHATIILTVDNATTVTGSAITVKQASAVAGTGEKALSVDWVWLNIDTGSAGGDVLVKTAVTSDTFTTDATNAKNLIYVLEIDAAELDVANGFDCIRLGTGDATAAICSAVYVLSGSRYKSSTPPAAITD